MKPRPSDIEWTRRLINLIADGGIWAIPRANSIWRFDKTNRVMILISGDPNELDNLMIKAICPLIGWTTAYKPETLTPEQIQEAMTASITLTEKMYGTGKSITRF